MANYDNCTHISYRMFISVCLKDAGAKVMTGKTLVHPVK